MPVMIRAAGRAAAAALALVAAPAFAQHGDDRWWFHVAAYQPAIESTAWSDFVAINRPGTVIRFEDELGLADRKVLPWFQAGVRAGERWRFELEYFALRRSGLRTASRDIVWGDSVFPATATLSSGFDSDVLRFSAGYSFLRHERTELGAVLGLHVTRFRVALASLVTIGSASGSGQAEAEEALVPLPTIGLYAQHDFDRRWSVSARIDYFSLQVDEYEGGLVNGMAAVGFRVHERFGIALGYRFVDYSLSIDKARWRGGLDYRFSGPFLNFQFGF